MGKAQRNTQSAGNLGTPGPGSYTARHNRSIKSPAFSIVGKPRGGAFGEVPCTPGPGAYFDGNVGGEAYSEITRTGGKTLAKASRDWARTSARPSTAYRFDDDF